MGTKITSKGQVTIPRAIRESLGVGSGDEVEFSTQANGTIELRRTDASRRVEATLARLRRDPPIKRVTTDEILDATRGQDR